MRWWESGRNLGFLGTVVAGVVIAALLGAFDRIPVIRWVGAIWAGLIYPVRVPLAVLVAMLGALLLVGVWGLVRAVAPAAPAWLTYREDTFLGIVWRWGYDGTHIAKWSLRPYCPQCSTGLRGSQEGYRELTISFICDECRFVQNLPGSADDVFDRICLSIAKTVAGRR